MKSLNESVFKSWTSLVANTLPARARAAKDLKVCILKGEELFDLENKLSLKKKINPQEHVRNRPLVKCLDRSNVEKGKRCR